MKYALGIFLVGASLALAKSQPQSSVGIVTASFDATQADSTTIATVLGVEIDFDDNKGHEQAEIVIANIPEGRIVLQNIDQGGKFYDARFPIAL